MYAAATGISDLITDLRRRGIFKIATAYTVTAWLLLQLASIPLPTVMAPPWVMQSAIVLIAVSLFSYDKFVIEEQEIADAPLSQYSRL